MNTHRSVRRPSHAVAALTAAALVTVASACGSDDGDAATTAADPTTTTGALGAMTAGEPVIAYQTLSGGGESIWLIGIDGEGNEILRIPGVKEALLPDWSSDGRQIVFATRGGETEPLYLYDAETGTAEPLFDCSDPCLGEDEPDFSPDGTQVAFVRALGPVVDDKPSDCGLWIGDVATRKVRQVTSHAGCDPRETNPRWSPDGTQLVYWTERYDETGDSTGTAVFVIGADGQGNRQLTEWEDEAGEADWSPDGEWIVYATHPLRKFAGNEISNLVRVHPDGTGAEPLTDYPDGETRATQPHYTPDGTQILFTLVTNDRDLAFLPADGGEVVPITNGGIHTHGVLRPPSPRP